MRTLGADPVQLQRSVRAEAFVIGTLATLIGVGAGIGVAFGLRALFGAIGADLPDSPTIVSLRTWLVAATVGVGVTVLSALGPARKASRVPPIEALRDGATAGDAPGIIRLLIGLAVTSVGVGAGGAGLFAASGTTAVVALLGLGLVGVFLGVTLLAPLLATPVTHILGRPAEVGSGVAGRLARHNAARNPQRTATTAAALMVGLALVTMALTVGESIKAQLPFHPRYHCRRRLHRGRRSRGGSH